jgi:ribosomal-protein-alanine N-acetyltransferase
MRRKKYATARFIIRGYTKSDYKAWFETYTNLLPKQNKFDRGPYPAAKCKKENYLKIATRHQNLAQKDNIYIWGIFDKRNGKLVGAIDIKIFTRSELQKANLGYQIFNNFWKQGIASEVLKKIVPLILVDLKLNRLEAVIDLDNRASINLCKSVGLRREGIRENYYFQDGDWADQIVYVADRKHFKLSKLIVK